MNGYPINRMWRWK